MSTATGQPQPRQAVPLTDWQRGCLAALGNAVLFLFLSGLSASAGMANIGYNNAIDIIFLGGCCFSYFALARAGGGVSAIALYVVGTGLLFGFGTYYSTASSDWVSLQFFPTSEQERLLSKINLLNALSVTVVLMFATLLCWSGPARGSVRGKIRDTMIELTRLIPVLAIVSAVYLALTFVTFPRPSDPMLRTFLNYAQGFVLFFIVICGSNWLRLHFITQILCIVIIVSLTVFGILTVSKTRALLPVVSFLIGVAFNPRARGALLALSLGLLLAYVLAIAPLCDRSRSDPALRADNTLQERIEVLGRTVSNWGSTGQRLRKAEPLLRRFSAGAMQAFLITQYDNGIPGNSMTNGWEALIPRIVWKDKPDITRFGTQFDELFFGRAHSDSSLAPSYDGELYWNGGWMSLIFGSMLVGLEIGWLTRQWNLMSIRGIENAGIVVFSVPAGLFAVWVENWFVATYVGGFVTLAILIKGTDFLVPRLLVSRGRSTAAKAPQRRASSTDRRGFLGTRTRAPGP